MFKKQLIFFIAIVCMASEWKYYSNGRLSVLAPVSTFVRNSSILFFQDSQGHKIAIKNSIVLYKPIDDICSKKLEKTYPPSFVLLNGDFIYKANNIKDAFRVSRNIYESGCVLFAHPDFILFPKKYSLDPLFPQQWNFYNYGQYSAKSGVDLNIYKAWQYATGKGVKVALLDSGFDLAHPDLKGAFSDQVDLVSHDNNASYDNTYEVHGTACAGLIGARKNGVGIQGVAYNTKLIGVKLIGSYPDGSEKGLLISDIIKAFLYADANGADVINCSWGTYNVADAVRDVIDDLAYHGRGGKGVPIVFATGNDGRGQWYWANDESALPSVIGVGAVDDQGYLAWYTNYGSALDFVAPSGGGRLAIATDDIVGPLGYADGRFGHPNYCYATDMTGFNGTSAAAPQISGVIALMLERNPDLTRDQIYDILARTAKKIGDIPYIDGRNDFFGYGLVDAEAAVKEAIRLRVESIVKGHSYQIAGYFSRIGDGKFDWIYVSGSTVAKLAGMDEDGHLIWDPILYHAFDTIQIKDGFLLFGTATSSDPLALRLSQERLMIEGAFVHYGISIYDWIYVTRSGRSYKLEGLSYDEDFLWAPLQIRGVRKNDAILFE